MFTNDQRQEERTGKYGSSRVQYLQELVSQFQNASVEETKEKIVANLADFAYDPCNYTFLHQKPNERLVEFGVGGICNACADPRNAAVFIQCGGIPLVIQCLSSPVRNTAMFYKMCLVVASTGLADAGAVNVSFRNLARAFLDKHVSKLDRDAGKQINQWAFQNHVVLKSS